MEKTIEPRADFSYTKHRKDGYTIIAITDKDLGGTSVTNDIENVVEFIRQKEKLKMEETGFVYMDSTKTWDGWNPKNGWFIALSTADKKTAIKKIVKFKHDEK